MSDRGEEGEGKHGQSDQGKELIARPSLLPNLGEDMMKMKQAKAKIGEPLPGFPDPH